MKGQNKLFFAIVWALILGLIAGAIVHFYFPEHIEGFSSKIKTSWDYLHKDGSDDYCTTSIHHTGGRYCQDE